MPSDIQSIADSARARALLPFILVIAWVLRCLAAVRRPLQVDEGYSLHLASLPASEGLRAVAALDIHPPLFLLVMHALVRLGVPDAGFRLIMAALGVVAVAMLYAIVLLWHGERAALLAAACAALMPSFIFYDPMIRMYALFDVLALASFLLLSVLCVRDDLRIAQRRMLWCGWALASAAMLWTLYLGFIVIAAQVLYAALVRRDALVRSLTGAAVACVMWLPQLPIFVTQLPRGGLAFPFYENHQLAAFFELPGQATIAVQTHGAGPIIGAISAIAWLWVIAAFALAMRGNAKSLCVWMAVPAGITLGYGLLFHKLLYTDRYYLVFAYALCALTGIAAVRLSKKRAAYGRLAAGCTLAVVGICGFLFACDPHLYTADWGAVGNLLRSQTQAGDLIVFEQGSPYFVLERTDALDHRPLILVFHREEAASSLRLARPFSRVWVVLFQAGPVDPNLEIVSGLSQRRRAIGAWQYPRWLPAESATVLLFAGRR